MISTLMNWKNISANEKKWFKANLAFKVVFYTAIAVFVFFQFEQNY